jgi:RNA polymerase sigma-70 factor (ECF subfamily)
MDADDRDDIALSLDGHPEAFGNLVNRYQRFLLAYLVGKIGNREEAEEAAQEAFVRAFVALGKLRNRDAFHFWLLGIANRVLKEHRRQQGRRPDPVRLSGDRQVQNIESHEPILEKAVAALPERYRGVVLLCYYAGWSRGQVARELGLTVNAVDQRLSRAYRMLRKALASRGLGGTS